MKKTAIIIVIVGVLALIGLWVANTYNNMVAEQENVETAWGQVQNQYQRRLDLIPNLVATVKAHAEKETAAYEAIADARSRATQITVDPTNLTEENIRAYQEAQGAISTALGRLLAITENYPELKMDKSFLELQSQLEGTENRIAVARNGFNDAAKTYNTLIRRFPSNIIASMFGFEKKPYFEAEAGAEKAPKVEF